MYILFLSLRSSVKTKISELYLTSYIHPPKPESFIEKTWQILFKPAEYFIKQLYLFGPAKLGFWQGISAPEMCAQLTKVNSELWKANLGECETLISRDFHAFYITISSATLLLLFWRFIDIGLMTCCSRRSIVYLQKNE